MRSIGTVILATMLLQPVPPVQSLMVGNQAIVLVAPDSFVEVSRVFPDGFTLRQETLPRTNRLLAWLIPGSAVKDRLGGVAPSYVTLQVQVLTTMIQGRYDAAAIRSIEREIREQSSQLPGLAQKAFDEVLRKPKFEELGLQVGLERSLGVLEQGSDFVTLGMVVFAKAAGNQVSSRLVLSCYFLVRGKILLLVVSGRDANVTELTATGALLGEWRSAMRAVNR